MRRFYRNVCIAIGIMAAAINAVANEPFDVRVGVDVRAVASNTNDSFVDGGYGRTRFDEAHDGLRFGSAYAAARYRLSDTLILRGDWVAYGDGHGAALDVTQLYLQLRPFPTGPVRWSARAGAFYPEFSMENRGPAWTPVYTLTPSAINSWYGEELRAIGVEGEARWLGASRGYQGDVALIAGIFGWNDPVGVVIAGRGWALHDRQTGLTGYLSQTNAPNTHVHEFREIDKRPGYYAGIDWRHGDRFTLRLYRYDNRADPAAVAHDYAWLTRFDAVGIRAEPNSNWTVLAQGLRGKTYVGPQDQWGQAWDLDAWYLMLSREWKQWRVSVRRDGFSTRQTNGLENLGAYDANDDGGHAWTVAANWDWREHWQVLTEWLQIDSRFPNRQLIGESAGQRERQLQLAIRYQWHY